MVMGTLYLSEQNAHLRKTAQRLVVERDGEVLSEIPAFKVERVVVFGNVQITTPALVFLLHNNIETALLSINGKLHGRLVPAENKNIYLRLHQYRAYHDQTFRLELAKELIRSKLTNARRLLQRLAYGRSLDLQKPLDDISRYAEQAQKAESPDSVRGYEGKGTAAYFGGFAKLVQGFTFQGREKRPAKDPVNSLLSFGYTLLSGEVFAALSAGGLDPYLGFFHEIRYGRASLCFDLCEEFRHLVVDGLVLDLINHRRIQEEDFEEAPDEEGVLLKPDARKKFLGAFEQKMSGARKGTAGQDTCYRMAIHGQVERMRDAIEGKRKYEGYRYS